MFSEPSSGRILESIRKALKDRVAPSVNERTAAAALEAIDLMVASLIRRVDCEAEWMRQEIDVIVEFAYSCIEEGLERDNKLDALLIDASVGVGAVSAGELRAKYKTAGALLNRCLDYASRTGGALQARADAIISDRVAHETEMLGAFHIVGKS